MLSVVPMNRRILISKLYCRKWEQHIVFSWRVHGCASAFLCHHPVFIQFKTVKKSRGLFISKASICLNIAKDSEKELFTFVQESSKFCFIKKKNCDHPVLYICYLPINKLCMINLTSFVFIGTSINIIRCKKLTQYIP